MKEQTRNKVRQARLEAAALKVENKLSEREITFLREELDGSGGRFISQTAGSVTVNFAGCSFARELVVEISDEFEITFNQIADHTFVVFYS